MQPLEPQKIGTAKRELETFIAAFELKRSMMPEAERLKLEADEDARMRKAYESMPESKILSQAYYLKEQMLPRIAEKRGDSSEDYLFYFDIMRSLMYMLAILGRDTRLRMLYSNEKLLREFYQNKCTFYERELQRFTSIEDLTASDAARDVMNMLMQNINPS